MNTRNLSDRKENLIFQIKHLEDEESVRQVENVLEHLHEGITEKQRELLKKLAKPMREKLDINELIREQNWKPSTAEEISEIIKDFDWEISDEDFIKELKSI
jgi:glucose-6-phosphate-specific signal transduction histidine kinase